jgi:hypothetical protein
VFIPTLEEINKAAAEALRWNVSRDLTFVQVAVYRNDRIVALDLRVKQPTKADMGQILTFRVAPYVEEDGKRSIHLVYEGPVDLGKAYRF